jgi:hypothetical protein
MKNTKLVILALIRACPEFFFRGCAGVRRPTLLEVPKLTAPHLSQTE